MAIDFNESKTKENLMKAFAGESQARNRYTIAAEAARHQGMQAVGHIFQFTAEQERAHAQVFYNLLKKAEGTTIDICGGFPVDTFDSLLDLVKAAEHNETEEYEDVYQAFGDTAKEEGFYEAASAFYQIAEVENIHAKRFGYIKKLLEKKEYFEPNGNGTWMCLNCGYVHEGGKVPEICPICRHDKGYFIPLEMAPYTCSEITAS
ncbi:MAG: rubrerythrin family protein [Eubacteriales bacterium]|nr:rubrerythrin family protein [Eubacteriales bacterium]